MRGVADHAAADDSDAILFVAHGMSSSYLVRIHSGKQIIRPCPPAPQGKTGAADNMRFGIANLGQMCYNNSLFEKAAALGVGIELNESFNHYTEDEWNLILRPYRIAKSHGCKFYLGSDAHTVKGLEYAMQKHQRMVEDLGLTEEDKFTI